METILNNHLEIVEPHKWILTYPPIPLPPPSDAQLLWIGRSAVGSFHAYASHVSELASNLSHASCVRKVEVDLFLDTRDQNFMSRIVSIETAFRKFVAVFAQSLPSIKNVTELSLGLGFILDDQALSALACLPSLQILCFRNILIAVKEPSGPKNRISPSRFKATERDLMASRTKTVDFVSTERLESLVIHSLIFPRLIFPCLTSQICPLITYLDLRFRMEDVEIVLGLLEVCPIVKILKIDAVGLDDFSIGQGITTDSTTFKRHPALSDAMPLLAEFTGPPAFATKILGSGQTPRSELCFVELIAGGITSADGLGYEQFLEGALEASGRHWSSNSGRVMRGKIRLEVWATSENQDWVQGLVARCFPDFGPVASLPHPSPVSTFCPSTTFDPTISEAYEWVSKVVVERTRKAPTFLHPRKYLEMPKLFGLKSPKSDKG